MSKKTSKHKNGKTRKESRHIVVGDRTYTAGYQKAQQEGVQIIAAILRTVPEEKVVVPEKYFKPDHDIMLEMKMDDDKNRVLFLTHLSDANLPTATQEEIDKFYLDDDPEDIDYETYILNEQSAYEDEELREDIFERTDELGPHAPEYEENVQEEMKNANDDVLEELEGDTIVREGLTVSGVTKRNPGESFPHRNDATIAE